MAPNGARDRNRTGTVLLPQDFKSCASTNFATRAHLAFATCSDYGGRSRNRTGVDGVAVRCMTTLPSGLKSDYLLLERETRLELATPTLARLCSTTELFPRSEDGAYSMYF